MRFSHIWPVALLFLFNSAHAFNFQQLMAIPEIRQMMPAMKGLMRNPQVKGLVRQMAPMLAGVSGASGGRRSSPAERSSDLVGEGGEINSTYNIRKGPGKGYRSKGTVGDFADVTATGRKRDGWIEVSYDNGKRGWVNAKALQKSSEAEVAVAPEEVKPVETTKTNDEQKPTEVAKTPEAVKPLEEKVIDKSKPQCAENRQELEANSTLKAALKGYNPFTTWKGGNSDFKFNEKTGKMQTVIHSNVAAMAQMMGYKAVMPLNMKVCLDSAESKPYVVIAGTKYDTLVREATMRTKDGSDTYKIN